MKGECFLLYSNFISGILFRMTVSFLFTHFLFPYIYKIIFDIPPYFFSYVLVFPICYAIIGAIVGETRLRDLLNGLKIGAIMFIPGFFFSFFYTVGYIAYFVLFYYLALRGREKSQLKTPEEERKTFTA